jgi:hypothetical protein
MDYWQLNFDIRNKAKAIKQLVVSISMAVAAASSSTSNTKDSRLGTKARCGYDNK